jgi:isopenicillin N synthase-like dioxygenase
MSEKMNIAIDSRIQGYLPLGYRSYEGEERAGTSHQEGFWVGYERAISSQMPLSGPNQWPKRYPALKDAMLRYFDCLEGLTEALLQGFSLALGLSPGHLSTYYKQPLSRLKVNHYPPQHDPVSDDDIGVVPHSDSGGFTILWQDEWGGLEIQNKNGEWVGASPVEGTFVINIGNIMQIWSNGEFSSTPHRVVNRSGQDRYSIPLFVNPSADTLIMPVVGESELYDSFNYGHYQRDLWRRTFPIANID